MCGGTFFRGYLVLGRAGLSPRVRGNLPATARPGRLSGSIPACAGEPTRGRTARSRAAVYPRVCGGTANARAFCNWCEGLSPRVRGNRRVPSAQWLRPGSIPACAGEPAGSVPCNTAVTVYPRVCGGTIGGGVVKVQPHGLSPRVRGNLRRRYLAGRDVRSIPACAGEPAWGCRRPRMQSVYPRVCGGTLP